MQVGILEDDAEQREALALLLRRHGHEAVTFASSAEVERAVAKKTCPRVLLCDLDLGTETAMAMAHRLAGTDVQLIAVTSHAGDAWVFPALAAGFVGYVLKSDAFDRIGDVVAEVEAGGAPLTREIARRVLSRFAAPPAAAPEESPLSPREVAVLQELADGYRYEQVALRLGISVGSVRTYVRRLYGKLGVSTKSEATAIGIRRGLVT